MKTKFKVVLRTKQDFLQLRNDSFGFNALLDFVNKWSIAIAISNIKVVTSGNLVLEFYRDKHNNLIYREYEKD